MEIQLQEDNTKVLYEASMRGCVRTLNLLLEKDPLLLNRISSSFLNQTPLHISSLLDHVEFTKALLSQRPKFAEEVDSLGQSPLHLASAEGNIEIVNALLSVNKDVCLVSDHYGRIPLHLAAIRGRVRVMEQLIIACPESVRLKLAGEESVLHLCARYNHLECLVMLVTFLNGDVEFLNSVDKGGNTIFQLAASLKQVETIKYLLSVPEVTVEADALAIFFNNQASNYIPKPIIPTKIQDQPSDTSGKIKKKPKRQSSNKWDNYLEKQRKTLKLIRGNLMIVATVIASITFQAAVQTPHDLWQNNFQNEQCNKQILKQVINNKSFIEARNLVIACVEKYNSYEFIICNTVSFSTSLSIIFFLVIFPFKHKFSVYMLAIAMSITVIFMAGSYILSISLADGSNQKEVAHFNNLVFLDYLVFWFGLLGVVIIVFSLWLMYKSIVGVFLVMKYIFRGRKKKKVKPIKQSGSYV